MQPNHYIALGIAVIAVGYFAWANWGGAVAGWFKGSGEVTDDQAIAALRLLAKYGKTPERKQYCRDWASEIFKGTL